MLPVMWTDGRDLDWDLTPTQALRRWPVERGVVLLHSGRWHPRWARWSVLAEPTEVHAWPQEKAGDPVAALGERIDDPALHMGWVSYDIGRSIERLPDPPPDDRGWPVWEWMRCDGWLVHDTRSGRWTAHGSYSATPPPLLDEPTRATWRCGDRRSSLPGEAYEAAVAAGVEYIAAGDIFQVNLAQRLTRSFDGDPGATRALYARLAEVSPAWYGAYLELPGGRRLLSTSPELFLDLDAQRNVTTRPIKGTRPADTPAAELRGSEKDAAELHMIVDLLRNDLGRVCEYGSVRVTQPREIEHHPTVQHTTATITGRLHPTRTTADLLRATLPGGSITGAPKVRAMQIIDELEPVRRGPYCGAIGMSRGGHAAAEPRHPHAGRHARYSRGGGAGDGRDGLRGGGGHRRRLRARRRASRDAGEGGGDGAGAGSTHIAPGLPGAVGSRHIAPGVPGAVASPAVRRVSINGPGQARGYMDEPAAAGVVRWFHAAAPAHSPPAPPAGVAVAGDAAVARRVSGGGNPLDRGDAGRTTARDGPGGGADPAARRGVAAG